MPPSLKVLIVDDESLIRWSVATTLAEAGHVAVEAGNGQAALHALKERPPFDVVLLDYRLPDSSDWDLLRAIRESSPATAVVVMTAHSSPDVVQGALDLGAHRVVQKPFKIGEITDLMLEAHAVAVSKMHQR